MERQTVRLQGGPLDGQTRHVHPTARMFTEEFQTGVIEREYGGVTVEVAQLDQASYRRVDDDRFVFCATQTAMGAPNPDFYKEEPEMSETATPDPTPPAPSVPPVQQPADEPDTTEEETTEETEGEVEF